jgi:hypothetical protein
MMFKQTLTVRDGKERNLALLCLVILQMNGGFWVTMMASTSTDTALVHSSTNKVSFVCFDLRIAYSG